jgi:23S rRNA (uridine2552-2'-O)-methyltransferase
VVGPRGAVLGVDVEGVSHVGPPVETLRLDFTEPDAAERIAAALGRPADALLSDAAPKLSGIRDVDRAASEELCDAALRIAERVLRPGGALVVKAFPGPETERFRAELRRRFGKVESVRPEATRKSSKEFYLVAGATPGRARH